MGANVAFMCDWANTKENADLARNVRCTCTHTHPPTHVEKLDARLECPLSGGGAAVGIDDVDRESVELGERLPIGGGGGASGISGASSVETSGTATGPDRSTGASFVSGVFGSEEQWNK